MTSGRPDDELIGRSRSEPAAFAVIFDRHHAQLYRYLNRRVGAALAADLAAETFVVAFARRGDYRPGTGDARPWLYGIAHNLLRNQLRQERRQLAAYARRGVDPLADPESVAEFARADSRADAVAASAALAEVLARMSARDRDVLLLYAWADLSYAEIAAALEIPLGTVRSRLNRARRQLRVLAQSESLRHLGRERWTS